MIKVDAHFPSVYTYLYYTPLEPLPPRVGTLTTPRPRPPHLSSTIKDGKQDLFVSRIKTLSALA